MLDRPLNSSSFWDAQGNLCQLGDPAIKNTVQGTNVLPFNNQTVIDFTSTVNGYNFTYPDLTLPNGTTYDVRWPVIITGNGSKGFRKRFILRARQRRGNAYLQPVTIHTLLARRSWSLA